MTIENQVDSGLEVGNTDQVVDTKLSLDTIIDNAIEDSTPKAEEVVDVKSNGNSENAKASTTQGSPKPGQKPAKGDKVAIESGKDKTGIPATEPNNVQNDILEAPQHWSADRKAVFNSLPPNAKQAWLQQAKDYERGMSEQGAKFADSKRYHAEVSEALKPYRAQIESMGLNDSAAIQNSLKFSTFVLSNPMGAIQYIMQQARITPQQLMGQPSGQEAKPVDPQFLAVNQELKRLQQQTMMHNKVIGEAMQKQGIARTENYIVSMQNAVDEGGNKMYPYMNDEFMTQMAQIISETPALKAEKDLAKKLDMAYKLAVANNYNQLVEQEAAKRIEQQSSQRTLNARPARPGLGSNVNTRNKKPGLDSILDDVFNQYGLE